jgi:hypothetical protein
LGTEGVGELSVVSIGKFRMSELVVSQIVLRKYGGTAV